MQFTIAQLLFQTNQLSQNRLFSTSVLQDTPISSLFFFQGAHGYWSKLILNSVCNLSPGNLHFSNHKQFADLAFNCLLNTFMFAPTWFSKECKRLRLKSSEYTIIPIPHRAAFWNRRHTKHQFSSLLSVLIFTIPNAAGKRPVNPDFFSWYYSSKPLSSFTCQLSH